MTITESTQKKLPFVSESDAAIMQLDSYVLHRGRQHCANCDCIESYSTLFEVWIHPTKTARSGLTTLRLHGAGRDLKNLPIAHITLPIREVPVCDDCIEWYQGVHGFKAVGSASREAWADTLRRKYAPEPSRSESPESRKPTPTVDML